MKTRKVSQSCCSKATGWALLILSVVCCAPSTQAQIVRTLIQFTNVWRYDQSGLELGTAWRTNDFDDSAWTSGRGLLGFEDNLPPYAVHAPLLTPLTISSTVTTFYFRTFFEFTGGTAGLSLIASNLVDDGCVIYLNGLRVGGVRAPANHNATTLFGTPPIEGQMDTVALTPLSALRQGENLMAVEVHQAGNTSADIMWGMKLMTIRQTPLTIIHQPQSQSIVEGEPVTFAVGLDGRPASYRWQKDGADIASATSSFYSITRTVPASAGQYRVVATNNISAVTSAVATLTILPDMTGPRILAAIANNGYGSNSINLTFSENLDANSARNQGNYTLTRLGTTNTVSVSTALYSTALGVLLGVEASDPDWSYGADYVVTVSHVKDARGNVIAPDTHMPVSWPHLTQEVLPVNAIWSYHSGYSEPDIYNQPWEMPEYVESQWWSRGPGPFCGDFYPAFETNWTACLGPCQSRMSVGLQTSLFRATFQWPTDFGSMALLSITTEADDAILVYLNGREIWRNRLSQQVTRLPANLGLNIIWEFPPLCLEDRFISVTNLLPRTNWIGVGVVKATVGNPVEAFALQVTATSLRTPALPDLPPPTLDITPLDTQSVRLSWTGHGYALESATNLTDNPASYPFGPWREVPNMSNPFTNSLSEPARFFRLSK